MVLLIIAIFVAATLPAIDSAFTEKSVNDDAHQLALMIKAGMLASSDEHRPYALDLSSTTFSLHPLAVVSDTTSATSAGADSLMPSDADSSEPNAAPAGTIMAYTSSNPLSVPDPEKEPGKAWISAPATTWIFEPNELCPATPVRITRGASWVEMNFNPLTGNVENDSSYFP